MMPRAPWMRLLQTPATIWAGRDGRRGGLGRRVGRPPTNAHTGLLCPGFDEGPDPVDGEARSLSAVRHNASGQLAVDDVGGRVRTGRPCFLVADAGVGEEVGVVGKRCRPYALTNCDAGRVLLPERHAPYRSSRRSRSLSFGIWAMSLAMIRVAAMRTCRPSHCQLLVEFDGLGAGVRRACPPRRRGTRRWPRRS